MIRRDRASFAAAAIISLAVHASAAVYFVQFERPHANQTSNATHAGPVSLTLTRAVPAEPIQEPLPVPAPRPAPVPQPANKPEPRPVTKQAAIPAPVRAAQQEPDPGAQPPQMDKAAAVVDSPSPAPTEQPAGVSAEETYLARLLEHIDGHKFYPRGARRRGLEGRIKVSFRLLEDGGIRDLQVSGENRALRKAAEQAIQRALPLPPPPGTVRLQPVNFDMEYRLGKA